MGCWGRGGKERADAACPYLPPRCRERLVVQGRGPNTPPKSHPGRDREATRRRSALDNENRHRKIRPAPTPVNPTEAHQKARPHHPSAEFAVPNAELAVPNAGLAVPSAGLAGWSAGLAVLSAGLAGWSAELAGWSAGPAPSTASPRPGGRARSARSAGPRVRRTGRSGSRSPSCPGWELRSWMSLPSWRGDGDRSVNNIIHSQMN